MFKYKVFVINLPSAVERRKSIEKQLNALKVEYEIIEAIYGKELSKESSLASRIDWEWAEANAFWVSNGALACSLSHIKACQAILDQDLDYGLILEDDTILDQNVAVFLETAGKYIAHNEVLLLYYSAWNKCTLSKKRAVTWKEINNLQLLHPTKGLSVITANAYVLGKEACKSLISYQTPVKATADSWTEFVTKGNLEQIRCVYPFLAKAADFKSSIDYVSEKSWKGKILNWIDKYKVPIIYQYLKYRRRKLREVLLNIQLVDNE